MIAIEPALVDQLQHPSEHYEPGSEALDVLGELVDNLEIAHPGMKEKLLDESGEIRRYVNIFINDEDIRFLDGKGSELKDADSVSIVPAIAGGGVILGGGVAG